MRPAYRCPRSKQELMPATPELGQACQELIEQGKRQYFTGVPVSDSSAEFLVTADLKTAYPVMYGIPRLLPELAISLEALNQLKSVD